MSQKNASGASSKGDDTNTSLRFESRLTVAAQAGFRRYKAARAPAANSSTFMPGAHDAQLSNEGTINVVGGNVHNHYHAPHADIGSLLRALHRRLPNFRKFQIDTLSKATLGTGLWLLADGMYQVWLDLNSGLVIFWTIGMPGAGKSVLAAIVINELEALSKSSGGTIGVAYLYIRYTERTSVRELLEVLVKQTAERHPDCLSLIEAVYAQHFQEDTQPAESELLALLQNLVKAKRATFYILDALDEAPVDFRLKLVAKLASLGVKLFITSRPLETLEADFPEAHFMPIVAQDHDLDLHIAEKLNSRGGFGTFLHNCDPEVKQGILVAVKSKAQGMFLHASLQMEALSQCISIRNAKEILEKFPDNLEDVYLQTWTRINNQPAEHAALAKRVLLWVLNAKRSMSLAEVRHAIATCPETSAFSPDRMVSEATIASLCCGLVAIDQESRLVRLVHYTAKETLDGLLSKSFPHPHSMLALVCMTHLCKSGMPTSAFKNQQDFDVALHYDPLLAYSHYAWSFHTQQALDIDAVSTLAMQFVMECQSFPVTMRHAEIFDLLGPLHVIAVYDLPLALLPSNSTLNPNAATKIDRATPLALAASLGHSKAVTDLLHLPDIEVNAADAHGWTPLIHACQYGHVSTAQALLYHPETNVNIADLDAWSALMTAVGHGHEEVARLLLDRGDTWVNATNVEGWSALGLASMQGYEGMAELLLSHSVIEVNFQDQDGGTALMVACRQGWTVVANLLLGHPETNLNLRDKYGWTALMHATQFQNKAIVESILAHPSTNVNLGAHNGRTALHCASANGNEAFVELLLSHPETAVNQADNGGWTPLAYAADQGFEAVVKAILASAGVCVNATDNYGCTALMMASRQGQMLALNLLLEDDRVDVNLIDTSGLTALMWGCCGGQEGSVALLLDHPYVMVDLTDELGRTPLMLAALHDKPGVVEQLLDLDWVEVDAIDHTGVTALWAASHLGFLQVAIHIILSHRADVNMVNFEGDTALKAAAAGGHDIIVCTLLQVPGVDIRSVGQDGRTALTAAIEGGFETIASLLLDFEAEQILEADIAVAGPDSDAEGSDEEYEDAVDTF